MDINLFFSQKNMLHLFDKYEELGPILGLLLPFIESFLPFLPLVVFVMVNAAVFGLWKGFLLSWIGASIGACLVFFMIRRLGNHGVFKRLREFEKTRKMMVWIEKQGFGPLFLMMSFPFTPSSLVNVVAGFSKVNMSQFCLAVILGKFIMIFTISWIGQDITSFFEKPVKSFFILVFILVLWMAGKKIEKRLQQAEWMNDH